MTDEMRAREKAICEAANVDDIGEVSDGFHTFNSLYEQRMILFAALVKAYKDKSWKSYRHEDGEYCFGGGWFIVGIDTPEGSYTYHYENKYFDLFDCEILDYSKHWDGHTEKDVTRLLSLPVQPDHIADIGKKVTDGNCISRRAAIELCDRYDNPSLHDDLEKLPPAQPDLSEYSDKLWKSAYERGKAEAQDARWIPCCERLPEDDKEVLFCINNGELWLGWHNITWKTEEFCFDKEQVIAWMPLPAPYKGGDSE